MSQYSYRKDYQDTSPPVIYKITSYIVVRPFIEDKFERGTIDIRPLFDMGERKNLYSINQHSWLSVDKNCARAVVSRIL